MKRALVIGIDHYEEITPLNGCVNDASSVWAMLEKNSDGSRNFDTKLLVSPCKERPLARNELRSEIQGLFKDDCEIALLYFAGHGYIESAGGFLCTSDTEYGHDGISLHDIVSWANTSKSRNKIIILDSCHSGVIGNNAFSPIAEIATGVTMLAASTETQYASELNGSGVFTTLLVDALEGAAANLLGEITPGSIYAHIDQSLGAWAQRPVFKTNVKSFVSLRKVQPPIKLDELQKIVELFPDAFSEFPLDPSFEPERSELEKKSLASFPPDPVNCKNFSILQKYNRVNLVVPVGAPHMYHAAMNSKSCKLTALGRHYHRLVSEKMI